MDKCLNAACFAALALTCIVCNAMGEVVVYSYDSMGRLTRAQAASGDALAYQYDLAGNRISDWQGGIVSGVDYQCADAVADLDRDGVVTLDDRNALLHAYGAVMGAACYLAAADYNCDGRVDLNDLQVWYRAYPQGSWRPGDWTARPTLPSVAWDVTAPDGRVDFFDLAALAQEWGPARDRLSGASWMDLAPETPDGAVSASDLAVFRENWLTGSESTDVAAPTSGCVQPRGAISVPDIDAVLEIRSRDAGSADSKWVVLDVLLVGAGIDVSCFQFILDANINIDLGELNGADERDTGPFWLGGDDVQDQSGCFFDVRPLVDGILVTGAYLDCVPASSATSIVLCSIIAPRSEDERAFAVREILCSVSAGAVYPVSDWFGNVSFNPVPAVPVLLQNRPNPFNPATSFKYAVPAAARVQLRVFDVRGRLVSLLIDQVQERGWHERSWNGRTEAGRAVASGVYFYKLEVDDVAITGKMTLVR